MNYTNLIPMTCTKCQGYLNLPFTWSSTVQPKMCTCSKKQTLAWECPRCHKINAPFKSSCNCLPFNPMGTQPSCNDSIFPDPKGATNINYDTLNKHTIDDMGHWNFRGPHYNPYWDKTPFISNKKK